jgi:hypothetical protein
VRYVEADQLGGSLTQRMALNFALAFEGTANGRAIRYAVHCRFCNTSPSMIRGPRPSILVLFPDPAPFPHRVS